MGRKGAGLAQHRVDQGGLSVVDVGDDGDIAHIIAGGKRHESVLQWRARGVQKLNACSPAWLSYLEPSLAP